jgi:DNA-binding transcriptional LysR family regulator
MDRFEAMNILVTIAETGSFTAAGKRLGVPLPTVSRKLAELEEHLGARLFARSTRRLDLTAAGADYLAACKRILEDIDEAERKASGEYVTPKGDLVLAAPVVFGRLHVVPIVAAFLASYPDIDIRLVQSDRNAQLLDDHIDLAMRIDALPDSSLIAVQVGSVRQVVCASPEYLAAHGTPSKPADLSQHSCITFDALGSSTSWRFESNTGRGVDVAPVRSRFWVNTAEAALDAAMAGAGVTRVLSYQAAKPVEEGKLRLVLESFEPSPVPVSLIHTAQGMLPLKTRSFIDFAVPRLRAILRSGPES